MIAADVVVIPRAHGVLVVPRPSLRFLSSVFGDRGKHLGAS